MHVNNFNELNKEIIKECFKLLNEKGHDYTDSDNDALSNFKITSNLNGLTPLQNWSVLFSKQILAIFKYVKTGELKSETIQSRICDSVNYLLLLNGLIKESQENQTTTNEKL